MHTLLSTQPKSTSDLANQFTFPGRIRQSLMHLNTDRTREHLVPSLSRRLSQDGRGKKNGPHIVHSHGENSGAHGSGAEGVDQGEGLKEDRGRRRWHWMRKLLILKRCRKKHYCVLVGRSGIMSSRNRDSPGANSTRTNPSLDACWEWM